MQRSPGHVCLVESSPRGYGLDQGLRIEFGGGQERIEHIFPIAGSNCQRRISKSEHV